LKYLLDTNTCVYLLNGNEILKRKVKEIGVYSLSISNCVLAELYFGAYNSKRVEENLRRIDLFKNDLSVLNSKQKAPISFYRILGLSRRNYNDKLSDYSIFFCNISIFN